MSMGLIASPANRRPAPTLADEPAASFDEHGRSAGREPVRSAPASVAGGVVAERPPCSPHRRHAAAMIRQLGGRTDAALRRELDRFFAARPGLSHADRAAIARAMSRFRNQLLHHPRTKLRSAAADDLPAGTPPLLDAVRRLFGLTEPPHASAPSDAP